MTVIEVLSAASLKVHGPKQWKIPIPEESPGVFVVTRNNKSHAHSRPVEARFRTGADHLLADRDSVKRRWLPREPIVFIGKTERSIRMRMAELYDCGRSRSNIISGAQSLCLLRCTLWVYWCPCSHPTGVRAVLLDAFVTGVGMPPFANYPDITPKT